MKPETRQRMRQWLMTMPEEERAARSRRACERLVALEEFRGARTAMLYLAVTGELDADSAVLAALAAGKTALVPKVDKEHWRIIALPCRSLEHGLVPGPYGIREPAGDAKPWPTEDIDLIVVPALAYDRRGHRLGRGGGFYDRFLAQTQLRAVKCGLAFAEQVIAEVPVAAKDVPVDMLVTDKEVLRVR